MSAMREKLKRAINVMYGQGLLASKDAEDAIVRLERGDSLDRVWQDIGLFLMTESS